MTHDDHLQEHLELCKSIYDELRKAGKWPWPDSPNLENLVESDDNDRPV
ncbi:hypothetical protein [Roseovarius nitratireducens]|nr:hypothetical protein [Roseovarius nitratireducens]